jgi:hypothetical protein
MSVAEVLAVVALSAVAGGVAGLAAGRATLEQASRHRAAADRAAITARGTLAVIRSERATAEGAAQDAIATEEFEVVDELLVDLDALLVAEGLEDVTTAEDSFRRIVRLAPREGSPDGTTREGGVRGDG